MSIKQWRNGSASVLSCVAAALLAIESGSALAGAPTAKPNLYLAQAQPGGQPIPALPNPFDEGTPPSTQPSTPAQPERTLPGLPSSTQPGPAPDRTPSFEAPATEPRSTAPGALPSIPLPSTTTTTPPESGFSPPSGGPPGPANPFAEGAAQTPPSFGAPGTTEPTPDEGPAPETSVAEQEMAAGVKLLNEGKFEEAVEHFKAASKLTAPEDGAPYLFAGIAYRFMNRYDDAIDAFTAALQRDQFDAEAYLRRGIVWFYKGEYGIAWADFDEAAIILYDDPQPELWKGLSRARQGRWLEAINAYAVALEYNDKFAPAWVNLGLGYLELNQPNKAVYCFDHAIRVEPKNAANYFKRGVALSQMGKMREAADSYSQAIRLQPNYAEAYFNRGLANQQIGQSEQASKDRAQALKLNPNVERQLSSRG
jgi:Flp pilus assembly protein TadD